MKSRAFHWQEHLTGRDPVLDIATQLTSVLKDQEGRGDLCVEDVLQVVRLSLREGVDISSTYFLKTETPCKTQQEFVAQALSSFGEVQFEQGFLNICLNSDVLQNYASQWLKEDLDMREVDFSAFKKAFQKLSAQYSTDETFKDVAFTVDYALRTCSSFLTMATEMKMDAMQISSVEPSLWEEMDAMERILFVSSLCTGGELYRACLREDEFSFAQFLYNHSKVLCHYFEMTRILDEQKLQQTAFRLTLLKVIQQSLQLAKAVVT